MYKICCFFGHRKIVITVQLEERLYVVLEELILAGVDTFIFGSRSEFNDLCYDIVLKLKEKYPYIKRVKYNAPHECAFTSKEDALKFADTYMNVMHEQAEFQYFEKVIDSDRAYHANKKAYVIRNQEMIDASDICIFYYNESYQPPLRKNSKKDYTSYQPKSGTGIAFAYAKQKKKKIINLFE